MTDLVPVTVIGGYLGAGKTTLVAHLLATAGGRRLAVLVNDFGALNLDAALLRAPVGMPVGSHGPDALLGRAEPEVVELTNGCVCCSMADSLGDGLDAVLGLEPRPDHIVIEASGVADPGRIADYGRGWPGTRLDAVVTVAALDLVATLADDTFVGSTIRRQLAAADIVVATRGDLASAAERVALSRLLDTVAPDTPVVTAEHGVLDPAVVLEPTFSPGPAQPPPGGSTAARAEPDPGTGGADVETSPVDRGPSTPGFRALTVPLPDPVDLDRLGAALTEWPAGVVRVKGVVADEHGRRHLVHRVGRRWTIEAAPSGLDVPPTLVVLLADRADEGEASLQSGIESATEPPAEWGMPRNEAAVAAQLRVSGR